jgi:uncharacterized protein YbjT (DUF2867 family)
MKTLVLGGTGFVGRRLVEILAGHDQTLEWLRRSGAAVMDLALSDPLWGRTFDLAYEAEVAALARAR